MLGVLPLVFIVLDFIVFLAKKIEKRAHQIPSTEIVSDEVRYEGHSPDTDMMESFFGILKSEMFYGDENTFKSLNQLEQANVDYIDYYNNK